MNLRLLSASGDQPAVNLTIVDYSPQAGFFLYIPFFQPAPQSAAADPQPLSGAGLVLVLFQKDSLDHVRNDMVKILV